MKDKNYGYSICTHCRKVFKKILYSDKYCSQYCKDQFESIRLENIKHVENARFIIFERDEFRCIYCGRSSIEHGITLHIDHIEPFNLRMNSNIYNLITSCEDCNKTKGPHHLKISVYNRIIEVNLERTNKKISEDSRSFVNIVMERYFNEQKKSTKIAKMLK